MAIKYNKPEIGLFENGFGKYRDTTNFSGFGWHDSDSVSGNGCFRSLGNYASRQGSEFIPVNPELYQYEFGLSAKTIKRNYNNKLGSGHLGFACYDKNKSFISHVQCFSVENTTLTRATSQNDTAIYVADASAWYVGSTGHKRSINFYPADHPDWNVPGKYTRYSIGTGYIENGVTDIGGGEYEVTLTNPLGANYEFPIGTPVGRSYSGGSYNYALGNPWHPEEWTTYTSGVMSGYAYPAAAANFRDQTRYIRFLNLQNYSTRTESEGDPAIYLLDNIIFIQRPLGSPAVNPKLFSRGRWK